MQYSFNFSKTHNTGLHRTVPDQKWLIISLTRRETSLGTSAFVSISCLFSIQSRYSVNCRFPSTKWSETCTTTKILLTSVSLGTIWGGGCNMHFYPSLLSAIDQENELQSTLVTSWLTWLQSRHGCIPCFLLIQLKPSTRGSRQMPPHAS